MKLKTAYPNLDLDDWTPTPTQLGDPITFVERDYEFRFDPFDDPEFETIETAHDLF